MSADFFQYCQSCRKKFLSYRGGRPECLTCWAQRCPAVVMSLGGTPGGIMDMPTVPEAEEIFPEGSEGPFNDFDRRLREEVDDDR